MRLLPVGPDHVGRRAPGRHPATGRRRHQRGDGGQHLPLRHLCAHPRGHQARRWGGGRVSARGARAQAATSRRGLLKAGLAGGLLLGFYLPVGAASALPHAVNEPEQGPDDTAGKFAPNAFIRIARDGKTTLVMPQVEMGQGVYTAVAMILAEELDAEFAHNDLEHAPPNTKLYVNPLFGILLSG